MSKLSFQTLAAALEEELRESRAFQMFARRLGPDDVAYVSLLGFGHDGNVVEAKASAMEFRDAFQQAITNLNHATAPKK